MNWYDYAIERAIPEPNSGCLLWLGYVDDLGYGRASLASVRENKAHRIIWTLAHGPIPPGMKVLHRCDVRCCVDLGHLFLGTQADNVADMIAKGRMNVPPKRGSQNGTAMLDEEHVWAIRHFMLRDRLFSQAEIARSYGVSPMTISRIATGQSWSHVTENWPYAAL